MRRGLWNLQRAILATLDDARRVQTVYTGRIDGERVRYHGSEFELPPDVYDLRASLQYLARATGNVRTGLSLRRSTIARPTFASSFSRAVRGLVTSGYLAIYNSSVPRDPYREARPNRRLVRRTEKTPLLAISPDMYDAYVQGYTQFVERETVRFEGALASFRKSHQPPKGE